MNKQYIEKVDDVYRIAGTRVWLDSIVYTFWRGQTAESIAQSFPVLTLEHVSGALTFYPANKSHIDSYLKKTNWIHHQGIKSWPFGCPAVSFGYHSGGRSDSNLVCYGSGRMGKSRGFSSLVEADDEANN